jgi:integrase
MRRTGLRVAELRRLERDCVREDRQGERFLKVPLGKMNNERLVPLDQATLRAIRSLQRQAAPGGQLLSPVPGCPWQRRRSYFAVGLSANSRAASTPRPPLRERRPEPAVVYSQAAPSRLRERGSARAALRDG